MRLDLSALNERQRQAVTAEIGPLLVLAGAGTGKTRVITYRIAHLIRTGTPGDRLLGITFTNRAAREMKERLLRMYPDLEPRPWLSTFHSLGLRILRIEHERVGFRKNFSIYDESDVRSILTEVLRELSGIRSAETGLDDARATISRWKSRFVSPEDALEAADDDESYKYARAYSRYRDRLEGLHAVDFDDLIYRPVRLLEEDEEAGAAWANRFDQVLVDEYQDSNTAQYRFARLLAGERESLCVVGDDDQSIYAFRGAEVEKILSFRRDFPRAEVITLEENYRSVQTILDAANAVIGHNPNRHDKQLRATRGVGGKIPYLTLEDETAEAEEVVGRIVAARRNGVPLKDQAILLRSAIQSRAFEEKLRFFDIPYTLIGGRSFFDRREVRDFYSYLRLLVTPEDDIAALRILNVPRRGWGAGNREKLDTWSRNQGVSVLEALERVEEIDGITAAAKRGAIDLVTAIKTARAGVATGAAAAARALMEDVAYDSAVREITDDPLEIEARRRNLAFFIEFLERFEERKGTGRLGDFLSGITLDGSSSKKDDGEEKLTLLTFHGAKGLEFPHVYLVGIEEGLIPHKRSIAEDEDRGIEEERRLFYVAITRAQDRLVLTRASLRRQYGREVECLESRFAAEIPDELLDRREIDPSTEEPVDAETAESFLDDLKSKFR